MTTLTTYQQKALRLDKHIALTANAGSGKTFVLAQRFLKIILDEKIPIKKIVAITFTDNSRSRYFGFNRNPFFNFLDLFSAKVAEKNQKN